MNWWEYIGNTANIIQIISAIPLAVGAWLLFTRARRYKRKLEETEKTLSAKPMGLVLSVSGMDVTEQVRQWLHKNVGTMDIETYHKPGGVTRENIGQFMTDILKVKSEMTRKGVTEVHLFLMAPVAFGAAVGAILDNWVQVKVYHLNREKNEYEYWTYLHKGFIPGLDDSLLKEIGE
ncbi:MAG: SAVED domain-containing protein [Bacteroidetes bacterium]|nr:SAVED domain-containing protein [Bacteroidota bacterium]MCW5897536.1 SAVED domain-containing protein [Bacteroidota bacterium]